MSRLDYQALDWTAIADRGRSRRASKRIVAIRKSINGGKQAGDMTPNGSGRDGSAPIWLGKTESATRGGEPPSVRNRTGVATQKGEHGRESGDLHAAVFI